VNKEGRWQYDLAIGAVFGFLAALIGQGRGWVGWPLWLEIARDTVAGAILAVPILRLLRSLPDGLAEPLVVEHPLGAADTRPQPGRDMTPMARMHIDEREIDELRVRRLVDQQFPQWAGLPVRRIEPSGTENAIFRLGGELSVRLARREGPTEPGSKELEWLPRLASLLPLEIPVPVALGRPNDDYPWFWEIHSWVEGETVPVAEIDAIQAARDLATFVGALQQVSPASAPPGRGIPLADRDTAIRPWLARFDGDPAVTAGWDRALAAPPWEGPPVWHHGDLDMRNWLVREGRICGVIDWGSMGVGDPACDVMVAWKLHSAAARDAFRAALPTDDATWERARGWVLSQAVAVLAYYTPENNPSLYHEAESWLDLVLSEGDKA
jgi:aminoglycoside phosphotransferase (APT) family kinase protein